MPGVLPYFTYCCSVLGAAGPGFGLSPIYPGTLGNTFSISWQRSCPRAPPVSSVILLPTKQGAQHVNRDGPVPKKILLLAGTWPVLDFTAQDPCVQGGSD